MRASPLHAVLCIGALGCSDPRVEVQISGLDPQVDSLRVQAALRDLPGARVVTAVRGRLDSFLLRLPEGVSSALDLRVGGVDTDGCRRSEGAVTAPLPIRGVLPVALTPLSPPGCRLQVNLVGEGVGRVRSEPPGLDCPGRCEARFPAGTAVTLRAEPAGGTSYFTGWSQGCAGIGDCAVTIPDDAVVTTAGFSPKRACTGAFCWETPLPHGNAVRAVWARADSEVYAAGAEGLLMRWYGAFWTPLRSGVRAELHALAGRGEEVFVAGAQGTLLRVHRSDGVVTPVALPTAATLRAAAVADDGAVWLAGDGGTLLRGDGQRFTPIPVDPPRDLYGLLALGGAVVVVGDGGTALRWDGAALRALGPASGRLRAVFGRSADELLIAGEGGAVLRWDGAALQQQSTGSTAELTALWGAPGGPLWAAGAGGTLLRSQGGPFTAVSSGVTVGLAGLSGSGESDIWAVGEVGALLRWNGAVWTTQRAIDAAPLIAVGAFDASAQYTVSDRCALRNNQGGVWHPVSSGPFVDCNDAALGDGEVWAVGPGGLLMHYVERPGAVATWYVVRVADQALHGVARRAYDATGQNVDVWAVGEAGRLIHVVGPESGVRVVTSVALGNRALRSMAWVSNTEAWMVGDEGTTWRLLGGQAQLVPSGTSARLWRVVGLRDGGAIAVGEGGVALRFSGGAWSPLGTGTTRPLRALWAGEGTDVWAAGDGGTVLRFDGRTFVAVDAGTSLDLRGIYGRAGGPILVAGQGGAVLSGGR